MHQLVEGCKIELQDWFFAYPNVPSGGGPRRLLLAAQPARPRRLRLQELQVISWMCISFLEYLAVVL